MFANKAKKDAGAGGDDDDEEPEEDVEFLGKAPKKKDNRVTFYRKLMNKFELTHEYDYRYSTSESD
jgi:hypothetical protein